MSQESFMDQSKQGLSFERLAKEEETDLLRSP